MEEGVEVSRQGADVTIKKKKRGSEAERQHRENDSNVRDGSRSTIQCLGRRSHVPAAQTPASQRGKVTTGEFYLKS